MRLQFLVESEHQFKVSNDQKFLIGIYHWHSALAEVRAGNFYYTITLL